MPDLGLDVHNHPREGNLPPIENETVSCVSYIVNRGTEDGVGDCFSVSGSCEPPQRLYDAAISNGWSRDWPPLADLAPHLRCERASNEQMVDVLLFLVAYGAYGVCMRVMLMQSGLGRETLMGYHPHRYGVSGYGRSLPYETAPRNPLIRRSLKRVPYAHCIWVGHSLPCNSRILEKGLN